MNHWGHTLILIGRCSIYIVVENPVTCRTCRWRIILVVDLFSNKYLDVINLSFGQGSDLLFMDHMNQFLLYFPMEGLHVFHICCQSLTRRLITCKTFSKRLTIYLYFPSGCRPSIYSLIFLHLTGYDKLIQGARE